MLLRQLNDSAGSLAFLISTVATHLGLDLNIEAQERDIDLRETAQGGEGV
jgi:hypothetical protein